MTQTIAPNADLSLMICRPLEHHAQLIMQWRNDPHTLAMSFHQEPKVWETFWPEFLEAYFRTPALSPLFVCSENVPVAFLRFEPVPHPSAGAGRTVAISVMVAPEARGREIGAGALTLAASHLRETAGIDCILAEVRVENDASHRLFKSAGYRSLGEATKLVADTGEQSRISRYLCDLTPSFWRQCGVMVIAEAGSNWRMGTPARDLAMGRELIDVAAEAGADAVKFQTYRAETVYVQNAGASDYLSESGIKEDISSIFSDLAMPYGLVSDLAAYAKKREIAFMSTPFSAEDFAAIDPHVSAHKVASYEISHPHLLRLAGASGKPLVLSTGASNERDIAWAVETFRQAGGRDLALLQCTAKYPAPIDTMNLNVIPWLKSRFGVACGLSDHSRHPLHAPLAAVALGANVIEKHFTINNRLPGPDHAFALEPKELSDMVAGIRACAQCLGTGVKSVQGAEQELAGYARRGLQAIRDISKGECLSEGDNIAILRPGQQALGVHPRHLDELSGAQSTRSISAGEGIQSGDWIPEGNS